MRRLVLFWIILATAFGGVPVLAGSAIAESDSPPCDGGGFSLPSTSSTAKSCWAKRVTLKLSAPNTVAAISGSAVVKDTRPVDKGQLAYFSTTIHCYDLTNKPVFGVTAQRNIWPGANPAGNYPVAVFKNKPGTYRCQLEVKQYPTGAGTAHSYTLDSFNLTATPSISGASSGGPNGDSWDGLPPDHPATRVLYPSGTQGDDRTEVARTTWTVPAGQSTVQVSGMTNLTACTADSDVNNGGCPPKQLGSTKYQVQLLAWQTLSDGSTQCSAPKQYPDPAQVFTLDQYIHHYIPSATGTYTMSNAPGCTRTLVVKTIVTVIGPIAIYVGLGSSAVGAWA